MSDLKLSVQELVQDKGLVKRSEPFQLSSGEWSRDYIDGKKAFASGSDLRLVAEAVLQLVDQRRIEFDCVGGLTMGADPLAHAIAILAEKNWFSVRKDRKEHGKKGLIEGTKVGPGDRVLLVDDVVTTGKSIIQAFEAIKEYEADVVLAVCIVDRGKQAAEELGDRGVNFESLLTYADLGIEAVGAR